MTAIDNILFTAERVNVPSQISGPEQLSRVTDWVRCLGGKGLVTALCLHELGSPITTFSLVGSRASFLDRLPAGFSSEYLLERLEQNHEVWKTISQRQEQHAYPFLSPLRADCTLPLGELSRFIQSVDVVYLSFENRMLLSGALDALLRINIPVVCNLSLPLLLEILDQSDQSLLEGLVASADCLLMNEAESKIALMLLGRVSWEGAPVEEIVITEGERGGLAAHRPFNKWARYPASAPTQVVCVSGAGDTFNGAFIESRFVQNVPLMISCKFAAEVAAKKIALRSNTLSGR